MDVANTNVRSNLEHSLDNNLLKQFHQASFISSTPQKNARLGNGIASRNLIICVAFHPVVLETRATEQLRGTSCFFFHFVHLKIMLVAPSSYLNNVAPFLKNNTPLGNIQFMPYTKQSSSNAWEKRQVGNCVLFLL